MPIQAHHMRARSGFERIPNEVGRNSDLSLVELGLLVRGLIDGPRFNSIDEMADAYSRADGRKAKHGFGRDAYRAAAQGLAAKGHLARRRVVVDGVPGHVIEFFAEPFGSNVQVLPTPEKPSSDTTSGNALGGTQKPRSPDTNVHIVPTPENTSLGTTCNDAEGQGQTPRSAEPNVRILPTPEKPSLPPYTDRSTDLNRPPPPTPSQLQNENDHLRGGGGGGFGQAEPQPQTPTRGEAFIDAILPPHAVISTDEYASLAVLVEDALNAGCEEGDLKAHLLSNLSAVTRLVGVWTYRLQPGRLPVKRGTSNVASNTAGSNRPPKCHRCDDWRTIAGRTASHPCPWCGVPASEQSRAFQSASEDGILPHGIEQDDDTVVPWPSQPASPPTAGHETYRNPPQSSYYPPKDRHQSFQNPTDPDAYKGSF